MSYQPPQTGQYAPPGQYQAGTVYSQGQGQSQAPYPSQDSSGNEAPADSKDKDNSALFEGSLEPTAPPYEVMGPIAGYQDFVSPQNQFIPPPPSYNEVVAKGKTETFGQTALITENEAREALLSYVAEHCCYGKGAAQSLTFSKVNPTTAIHYELKTFLESRNPNWTSRPYSGGFVDGPEHGIPPQPWDMSVNAPAPFHDTVIELDVPHTSTVRTCHGCNGHGNIRCRNCSGRGRNRCTSCNGSGHSYGANNEHRSCTWCHGSGYRRCHSCYGNGYVTCPTCDRTGKVRCFILLTVKFETKVGDYILEYTALPDHLIRDVSAPTIFEDTQPRLPPVQSFPEQTVNVNSRRLIGEHQGLQNTGKIWMQNHKIRGVPVFQCDYQWKGQSGTFFCLR